MVISFCIFKLSESSSNDKDKPVSILVGPSSSGKTTLLYELLTLPVFQPRYQSVIFFYQHYQGAYEKLKRDVAEIEFIQ